MSVLTTAVEASVARPVSAISSLERVWRIVRLHYANRIGSIVTPWALLLGIFGVNLVIWYLIAAGSRSTDLQDGTQYTGSVFSIFAYQLVFAIQLMSASFSFAAGLSSTRRDFYLGTALTFLLHAAMFTAGLVLLSYLEQWTRGWGVGGHMFQTIYFGTGSLGVRVFTIYFALLGALFLGSLFGVVFVRWRAYGIYVTAGCLVLVLLGALALITFTDSWPAVGAWFMAHSTLGVMTWSLPVTALCAVLSFFVLRRAIPRS